jgi:hypothetical protein
MEAEKSGTSPLALVQQQANPEVSNELKVIQFFYQYGQ